MRKLIVAMALLVLVVWGGRAYFGPIRSQQAIGDCLSKEIDLNDPVPFVRNKFGGTVVGLAASGGGSRAAYLEAAILREIRRAGPALWLGNTSPGASLLEQLEIVSSVSGGSFAAAYFTLNAQQLQKAEASSPAWTEFLDKMAIEFRARQWYGQAAWNPANWARSTLTDYNRGVLARDDYDSVLYKGATLQDLPVRPALYVNAFDVANHVRFVLSKQHMNTGFFQPRGWQNKLNEAQTLVSANDLNFIRIEPASVRVADAVYASSAFPLAYPNLPLKHCGSKIGFQGRQIFLADGALADNSGLITLLTQLRAGFDTTAKASTIVAIHIDASVDRIDNNGSKFQQTGIEDDYAWRNTVVGHAVESIFGTVALMQDLGLRFVESMDVVTDQLALNWPMELTRRSGTCSATGRASWANLFETGSLALKPLVIRLGLRDVVSADFQTQYAGHLRGRAELEQLLAAANSHDSTGALPKDFSKRLQAIPTDFTLLPENRRLLDLVAYLLVHGKLAGDIARWNEIQREAPLPSELPSRCPM